MIKKEINELTDIDIYYEPITKGKKTVKIKIDMIAKVPTDKWIADKKNDELLGEL